MMPAINSKNGSAALLAKPLIEPSKADKIDRKPRQNLAALGAREIGRGQILDMLEQPRPHVRNQRSRELGVPPLVPDRNDRGDDPGGREHAEDYVKRPEILLAERIVDQELQAQRHDDIEQRLDQDAEADECQYFLVVLQERFDEGIDRRQRAGGFLRGKDNEILVLLVVVELKLVIIFVVIIVGRRRRYLVAEQRRLRLRRPPRAFRRAPARAPRPRQLSIRSSDDGGLDAMKPTDAARPA